MDNTLRERIVDTALTLAERRSWEALRLHDVAAELGIGLDEVHICFREKEEIADAWFDRADKAMLHEAARDGVRMLTSRERIHCLLTIWFSSLSVHKRVTRQMILGKLEPGHFHYQLAGLARTSRTVQWLREAAGRDAVFPRRAIEETTLTGIFLTTLGRWMIDDSADAARTASMLDKLLAGAERLDKLCSFGTRTP